METVNDFIPKLLNARRLVDQLIKGDTSGRLSLDAVHYFEDSPHVYYLGTGTNHVDWYIAPATLALDAMDIVTYGIQHNGRIATATASPIGLIIFTRLCDELISTEDL